MSEQTPPKRVALKFLKTLFLLVLAIFALANISANGFTHFLSGAGIAAVAFLFWLLIEEVWARPEGVAPRAPFVFGQTRALSSTASFAA
jgi:hypothetical protein